MTIEPDDELVQEALRKAAKKVAQRYNIPGFRKGKAPYSAVVRAYGKEVLYEQVAEELGDKVYRQALEETGLQPVAPGSLEDVTFDPLVFKLTLPMPPEVDLGEYRSIRLERPAIEVTDEEVTVQLESMQKQQSDWTPVEEGAAEMGDLLSLSLKGAIEEQVIIDEDAFELALEPENEDFPPGFDQQFVGQPVGAVLSFDLTYPEDWPSDRAGKLAHFEAEIIGIKRQDVPALDDDFAALVGDYDTLDELKQSVRDGIYAQRKLDADMQYANQMIDKVIEGAKIEFPPVLLEESLNRIVSEQTRNLERAGLPLSEYLRLTRQTEAQFKQQFMGAAEKRLRGDLVLNRLPEVEGLQATDDEIAEETGKLLASAGETSESLRGILASEGGRMTIANDILRQKALDRLVEIAEGRAPELAAQVEAQAEPEVAVADETQAEAAVEATS